MDPKDKKIADLEAELATAKATITEKDGIIEQKNQDIVGVRKKYSEMTEADKAKLTEAERNLAQQMEEFEAKQADFVKSQQDFQQNQVNYHKAEAIKKIVGNDPEAIKKIELAYGRILDNDKAQTPDEIAKVVNDAYNMLGEDRPKAVSSAISNAGGGGAPSSDTGSFADTAEGKNLSSLMGLDIEEPAPADPNAPPAPAPAAAELEAHI